ncbi:hypothetical protein EIP91_003938 [Steccherinum ochraceum]|uniref:Uncharacterized protein n=1 Tax=Steccherinum ochraceum TaxID=92696 RepID=A0A4R0RWN2_9APHY|nr:hypothetical protein EIP91_003938 [Steccherinum ochraceum]
MPLRHRRINPTNRHFVKTYALLTWINFALALFASALTFYALFSSKPVQEDRIPTDSNDSNAAVATALLVSLTSLVELYIAVVTVAMSNNLKTNTTTRLDIGTVFGSTTLPRTPASRDLQKVEHFPPLASEESFGSGSERTIL